ncbi:four helix bundle protein [Pelobium sp.]|nr:four helix bundle protein [Pelobium sp.]MDA9555332.1 four helix bundle protein [Pelobium sp.]
MRNDKQNLIVDLTFEFALKIMSFVEELELSKRFVFANQILKAGTSIGANVKEAQNAESKADFIHKLKIAAKEADEVEYFLTLCKESPTYPYHDGLIESVQSIIKVLSKIISSSKGG